MSLLRWAGWSGFGCSERKSRAGEGRSGIKEGGRAAFFFILRDLDCCNSGFRVMPHFPHRSRGGKAESAKEQGMDGLQERKSMCKVICAGAVGWKV